MSYDININAEKQLLYVCGQGQITSFDIDTYYSRLKEAGGVETCTKALINLSHKNVRIKGARLKNIRVLGLMFQRSPILPVGTKMAVIVSSTLAFGFVRLFMGVRGERMIIRPFKNMNDALIWLEISATDIPPIIAYHV